MSTLTAGAPSHVLLNSLERAGWGNLAGPEFRGVRGVLAALTRHLDPRSAQGKATAWEIAERAGYTERWTRRCLAILEELELIEWDRGGIVDGKPVPSWFRVSKRALLILVSIARTVGNGRRTERDDATRKRITEYRLNRTKRRHKRRPVHAEVVTALLSIEEEPSDKESRSGAVPATKKSMTDAVAQIRAEIRRKRDLRSAQGRESKTATTRKSAKSLRDRLSEYAPDLETTNTYAGPIGGPTQ